MRLIARCLAVVMIAGLAVVLPANAANAITNGVVLYTVKPWAVHIKRHSFDAQGNELLHVCTGIIVSANWVLTAAHCAYDDDTHYDDPSRIELLVGADDLLNPDDTSKHLGVSHILTSPDGGDLALLELNGTLPTKARPMAIAPAGYSPPNGAELRAFGYGHTSESYDPQDIRNFKADPIKYPLREAPYYSEARYLGLTKPGSYVEQTSCNISGLLCIHRIGRSQIMGGDSGGPWVTDISNATLVGITHAVASPYVGSPKTVAYAYVSAEPVTTALRHDWIVNEAGIIAPTPGQIVRDDATKKAVLIGGDGLGYPILGRKVYDCLFHQGHFVQNVTTIQLAEVPRSTTSASCNPNSLTFSLPEGSPTGTTVKVSGVCPSSSTNVDATASPNSGGTTYPSYVLSDGTFNAPVYLTLPSTQTTARDPSSGLPIWPGQTFAISVVCHDASGNALAKYSGSYTTTPGLAIRPSTLDNGNNTYNVTISPTSPCPLTDHTDLIGSGIFAYPTGSPDNPQIIGAGEGHTLDSTGSWTPFTYAVPKFAGGTTLDIYSSCITINEEQSFEFAPVSINLPAA